MAISKISVITVCYNACDIIEATIVSVINQTYPFIEYIVVDGNSNDGTQNIINSYRERISYYISEPDKGIYDAMNKGIKIATGDYILFMNAGDSFYNNLVLHDWVSMIGENDSAVYYGDVVYHYTYGTRYMKALPLEGILESMVFSHQSVMVSAKLLKTNGFDLKYKFAADYNLLLSCYLSRNKFNYTPIPIALVEMDEGATANNFLASKKEVLEIHKSLGYSWVRRHWLFLTMMLKYYLHGVVKCVIPTGWIMKIQNKKA